MVSEVTKVAKEDHIDSSEKKDTQKSRGRPVAKVILGCDPSEGGLTNNSMKIRLKEILNVAPTSARKEGQIRPPLAFGDQDLLDGKPNKYIPLLITAVTAKVEMRRISVDQESSAAIIFVDLLKVLNISTDDLTSYHGMDLTRFNGSTARPLVMVTSGDLMVSSLCFEL